MMRDVHARWLLWLICVGAFSAGTPAIATWHDMGWEMRRPLDVNLDWEKASPQEAATAEFYTAGAAATSGENIRVYTENGVLVPSQCLMVGPGDRMRIMFQVIRGIRHYYVYFGHPRPPRAPKGTDELPFSKGVLVEMRRISGGGNANDFAQIEQMWQRSRQVIGRTIIPQLFLGIDPFGDELNVIIKYTATLDVPVDGEYGFAISASDRGGVYVDGKPVAFARLAPHDVRFNGKIRLKEGKHAIMVYHANFTGEQRLTVVWSRPDRPGWHMIRPEELGIMHQATVGPLEQRERALTADMRLEYVGECFYENHYIHHYRFAGTPAPRQRGGAPMRWEWDFGDGQTATGQTVEHVYLTDGDYVVKSTVQHGLNKDTQSNRLRVSRDYERIESPPVSHPVACAKIVATYDLQRMPVTWLSWASLLGVRGRQWELAERAGVRLASVRSGIDANTAIYAMNEAADALAEQQKLAGALRIWGAVSEDSPYQPSAARRYAELLLWRAGDFSRALKVLEPFARKDSRDKHLMRLYGQALVLNQQAADGRKVLDAVPPDAPPDRQLALSGALARTTEYYITDRDVDAGEKTWDKWQAQYPPDFMEGYSVLLKTQLMENAKYPEAAAKLAEAFALAVPRSSYAPKLLDRASRLLERSDPAKSRALRQLLKQKYPEDPLAQ